MSDAGRDWDVFRNRGERLSESEIEFIRKSGLGTNRKTRVEVARELKCAVRTVDKYYRKFGYVKHYEKRKEYKLRDHAKPKEEKEKKVLPDRYYHSNFEPS